MYQIAKSINNMMFSKDRLRNLRLKYMNQFHTSIMKLYDLGYVSRVDCFLRDEVHECIMEEFREMYVDWCCDRVTGLAGLSAGGARLLAEIAGVADKEVFTAYADACDAEDMLSLFHWIERRGFVPKMGGDDFEVQDKISVSDNHVHMKRFAAVDGLAGAMSLRCEPVIDFDEMRCAYLKEELGGGDLLGNGLDDVKHFTAIMKGDVTCHGSLAAKFNEMRVKFYKENDWGQALGFDWFLLKRYETRLSQDLAEELKKGDFCFMTDRHAYRAGGRYDDMHPGDFYIGGFMTGEDDPLARLHGVGGSVCRSRGVLNAYGYCDSDDICVPVFLDEAHVDAALEQAYGVDVDGLDGMLSRFHDRLTCLLVQALVRSDCWSVSKGLDLPTHVVYGSQIDKVTFDAACVAAVNAYDAIKRRYI